MKQISTKKTLFRVSTQWKERIGPNTSEKWMTKEKDIKQKWDTTMHKMVANYARIYPWFSNMQSHFAVSHARFISFYDIQNFSWTHRELKHDVITGFRIRDNEDFYWAGVILENKTNTDTICFIRAYDGFIGVGDYDQNKVRLRPQNNNNFVFKSEIMVPVDLKGSVLNVAQDK